MLDRARACSSLLALLLLAASASAAGVVVVALDGSGDTFGVQAGVDLAAPGDLVVLREDSYLPIGPFGDDVLILIDKPLTLVGDGAGASIGFLRVTGLAAGERVVVRNVSVSVPPLAASPLETCTILNNAGQVMLEDCSISGGFATTAGVPPSPAVLIDDSAGVELVRCAVTGGPGLDTNGIFDFGISDGGVGLRAIDSPVAIHGSTVRGGRGGIDDFFDNGGARGGTGLESLSADLFVAGSTIEGGAASDGCDPGAAADCTGGTGMIQDGTGASLRRFDATIVGGAGGVLTDETLAPDGDDLVVLDGTVTAPEGTARTMEADALLREGAAGALVIGGPPGELARMFVGFDLSYVPLSGKKGVFALGPDTIGPILFGAIPASGEFVVPVSVGIGTLPPGLAAPVLLQGYTLGADGLIFTNPTSLVVVEAGL